MIRFPSKDLEEAYKKGSQAQILLMAKIRELAFATASSLEKVGEIEESLKWGEPAFSTVRPKTGSPFRIAPVKNTQEKVGLYFICTTNLVRDFRERYGDELTFEGNRAIILDTDKPLPAGPLSHCIAMALTYRLKK